MERTEASKRVNNRQSTRVSIDGSSGDEAVDSALVERSVIGGFDDSDLEETDALNKEDEYLSEKNNEKENIPVNMNVSPSPVLATIDSNNSSRLDTRMLNPMETVNQYSILFFSLFSESSISLKRKTSPMDSLAAVSSKQRFPKAVGYVSMREHAKLAAQLATADEQNVLYQSTWMRKLKRRSNPSGAFSFGILSRV